MKFSHRDGTLALDHAVVMGVLNVTPDSFSDGGLWLDPQAATDHAEEMASLGASIIDVGGESTRPGAALVSEDEELRRVIPVVEALRDKLVVPISIDTRKPSVARAALRAGAAIVNDTLGEATDGAIDEVAIEEGAGLIVMHSRGTPETMRSLTQYGDVVNDVKAFLADRARGLQQRGLAKDAIVLDPGFGFAKTPAQNLQLLKRLEEIAGLGFPLLAGTSRKSFIGAVLDLPEDERIEGTAATVACAVLKGAKIIRVHDVQPMMRTLRIAEAIKSS